jgi:hypothetical protein
LVEQVKQETIMRKIILTLAGAALIAGSTGQVAFSKERHHVRNAQQFNTERFRNAQAYSAPSYVPDASASSLAGAWGTFTGFH